LAVIRKTIIATLAKKLKAIAERSATKSVFIFPHKSERDRKAIAQTRPQTIPLTKSESQ